MQNWEAAEFERQNETFMAHLQKVTFTSTRDTRTERITQIVVLASNNLKKTIIVTILLIICEGIVMLKTSISNKTNGFNINQYKIELSNSF